jgi:hypothetical protein
MGVNRIGAKPGCLLFGLEQAFSIDDSSSQRALPSRVPVTSAVTSVRSIQSVDAAWELIARVTAMGIPTMAVVCTCLGMMQIIRLPLCEGAELREVRPLGSDPWYEPSFQAGASLAESVQPPAPE